VTFLQPFILWGLPLVLLPLLIHLLNRMRYRSVRWAAMSFLVSADRASTRHAKLRQFLILCCRVLALLLLVLVVGRPLAGGWLGWMLSPAPDTILLLLDRSASMEMMDAATRVTRREEALKLLVGAGRDYSQTSRFVLFESVLRKPQEISNPEILPELSTTAGTDTAADMPALVQAAVDWLGQNKTGLAEIWIASDLRRAVWQPESERWRVLGARLAAARQGVRIRLLALNRPSPPNDSVSIQEVNRREIGGAPRIELVFDVQRSETSPGSIPLTLLFNGVRSHLDVAMEGQNGRFHHAFVPDAESGWGKVELPADGNWRDNTAYFLYGPKLFLQAALVTPDTESRRYLRLACAPAPEKMQESCEIVDPGQADWNKYALVVWQAPLPSGAAAQGLESYARAGGVVLFFPTGAPDAGSFAGMGWGEAQTASAESPFRITQWDDQDGPLARSDEGTSLPLPDLAIPRRQEIAGDRNAWAFFADAQPFLTHRALGGGQVLFCASTPKAGWSNLGEGRVLVPLLQRLLEEGGRRFGPPLSIAPNAPEMIGSGSGWTSVDSARRKDPRFEAGIYRNGGHLLAVNRPGAEDNDETLEAGAAGKLFEPAPVQLFEDRRSRTGALQGEIWRGLLAAMLLILLAEGVLTLPAAHTGREGKARKPVNMPEVTARREGSQAG